MHTALSHVFNTNLVLFGVQLLLVAIRAVVPGRLTWARQALLCTKHILTGVPAKQEERYLSVKLQPTLVKCITN